MIAIGESPGNTEISHKSGKLIHRRRIVEGHGHDAQRETKVTRDDHQIGVGILNQLVAGGQRFVVLPVGEETASEVYVGKVKDLEIFLLRCNGIDAGFIMIVNSVGAVFHNRQRIDIGLGIKGVAAHIGEAADKDQQREDQCAARLVEYDISKCHALAQCQIIKQNQQREQDTRRQIGIGRIKDVFAQQNHSGCNGCPIKN